MYKDIKIKYSEEFARYTDAVLVTGDVNAYRIVLETPWELDGCNFKVTAKRADGRVVTDLGATEGTKAICVLASSIYSVVGDLTMQLTLESVDSTILTACELTATVVEGNGEGEQAENLTPVLDKAIERITVLEAEMRASASNLTNGDGENSIVSQKGKSITNDSVALGRDTVSGCRCFSILSVVADRYIILSNINGLKVGDVCSLITTDPQYTYYNAFTISQIGASGIENGEKAIEFEEGVLAIKNASPTYLWVVSNPETGDTTFSADAAFTAGIKTAATGEASASFGKKNISYGDYSFTAGQENIAAWGAFAVNCWNKATGANSFAANSQTEASGDNSFAVNYKSKAEAVNSFAANTANAKGTASFAANGGLASAVRSFAVNTGKASGEESFAANRNTGALGKYSAAFGWESKANGNYSFSANYGKADGEYSAAFGYYTKATGAYSAVFGNGSTAGGIAAFAANRASASNDASFATNNGTARGSMSFAANNAMASAQYSFGANSGTASEVSAFAANIGKASGIRSFAANYNTAASATDSAAFGDNTQATGQAGFSSGYKSKAVGRASFAANGESEAKAEYSFVANSATANVSAIRSAAFGWSVVTGENSFAANWGNANGQYSTSFGYNTTANGARSLSVGNRTIANGNDEFVLGKLNINRPDAFLYSMVVGNGTDEANRSDAYRLDWNGNGWFAGNVETTSVILRATNGNRYEVVVDNNGNLKTTKIA